jgi:hypothetical protein
MTRNFCLLLTLTAFLALGALAHTFAQSAPAPTPQSEKEWADTKAKYLQSTRDEHNHHIKNWTQVASYSFDDNKLPDTFKIFDGNWDVQNGKLVAHSGKKDGNRVIKIANCQWPAFKLEFDASLTANPGEPQTKISDIGVHLNASDTDGNFRNGYGVLAGTYGNQASVFYRLYIPYARTEWSPVVPGKTHHFVLEVVKPHFRYWVDGKVVLDVWERAGTKKMDNSDFMEMDPAKAMNIHTYDSILTIDNIKISVPEQK